MQKLAKLVVSRFSISLVFLVSGCATTNANLNSTNGPRLTLSAVFKYEGVEVADPYSGGGDGFVIGILHGSGKIATNDPVPSSIIEPTLEKRFVLNLQEMYNARRGHMKAIDGSTNPLVSISPSDTKIERVAIYTFNRFLYENGFPRDVGYTALNDEQSGNNLVLLATDRACTIKGRLTESEGMEDIDVEIESAGLHVLRLLEPPGARPKLVLADKNIQPRLVVYFYHAYLNWLKSNPPSMKSNRKLPVIR